MDIPRYYRGHKRIAFLAAAGFLVLIAAFWIAARRHDPPQYLSARMEQGALTAAVQATGTISPLTTVPVGSDVSGTVKYVFADFNSRVEAGQVLALIDPEDYQAQLVQAEGNLEIAVANEKNLEASIAAQQAAIKTSQANLDRMKAAADYARANTQRILQLAKEGIFSRDQGDQSQSGLDQADAQVRQAEAQLNQSVAQLAQTRAQVDEARAQIKTMRGALELAQVHLRDCTILSPIEGTVVASNVTVGQSVAASLQAPVVFSIAQDLRRMQLAAFTDESDTGNIKVGTQATFQVDAFPTETFTGRVSAIRLNATTIQNVVTYSTIINFDNPDGRLLPGETAYATIPTGHVDNVVKIPNAALRFSPPLSSDQLNQLYRQYKIPPEARPGHQGTWRVVWTQDAQGQIRPVVFRAGITDYTFTQLIDGDLKPGDPLITGQEGGASVGLSRGSGSSPPRFGAPPR